MNIFKDMEEHPLKQQGRKKETMAKIGEILVQKGYVTQQQVDGVMAVKGDDAQVGQVLIQW